mmetsp:Transcript_14572/g.20786  ORF Transcript_14572/g.20786 Transcript_14572/m.20786 type:complete len:94 (-) Transcript_14572:618-899(-)
MPSHVISGGKDIVSSGRILCDMDALYDHLSCLSLPIERILDEKSFRMSVSAQLVHDVMSSMHSPVGGEEGYEDKNEAEIGERPKGKDESALEG